MNRKIKAGGVTLFASLLVLTGCAADSGEQQAQTQAAGPAVAGNAAEGMYSGHQFAFSGHGGSSQDAQDAIFADFADITGARYAPDGPPAFAQIQAQVESGNVTWDLAVASDVHANDPELCGTMFEPIDFERVDDSNLPEIAPATDCGIPINANGWSFAYDTTVFGQNPTWEDFFDTEKYPGDRAIYSQIPQLQLEIGLMGDGVTLEEMYPLDVDRSLEKFDSIRDSLVFYTTGSESQQMLDSNQVVACLCWSGRVYTVMEAGGDWAISEAAPPQIRIDYAVIPKGSQNVDLAHDALNFFLGEEQQQYWQETTAYPSMNVNVEPTLSEAAEGVNVLDPRFNANRIDIDYWVENNAALTDRWTTWVSG